MRVNPLDTAPEAGRVELAVLRRIGPAARVRMSFAASDTLREIVVAGVRHRHPAYTDREVRLATLRLMLGPELFRAIHPHEMIWP